MHRLSKAVFVTTLIWILSFSAPVSAIAATETWTPGGSLNGGNGTWDSGVTTNWNSGQTWTDGNGALFTGTGGTVTLVAPSASALTFAGSGPYVLQSGTLTLTGSNVTVNGAVTIASAIDATGSLFETGTGALTLTGSSAINSGNLMINLSTVDIAGGGVVSDSFGYIGYGAGSNSTVTVTGAGSTWTNSGQLEVGGSGAGMLVIDNGGAVTATQTNLSGSGTLILGENPTLNSPLAVNSGGVVSLVDGQLQTVTLNHPVSLSNSADLSFEVGNGSDELAFTGGGTLAVTGTGVINLYGLSGLVTTGTEVIIGGTSGLFALGNVYNGGNFTYKLLSTATSEDVVVTATTALATAYWKGGRSNIWSVLVGGTGTNWTTTAAGTIDTRLTPSATTNVIFSAATPLNEGNTVLGSDMTIASLTISSINAVSISGSESDPLLGTDTLTFAGTTGTGIVISGSVGQVTISANVELGGTSEGVVVSNTAGLLISGSIGGVNGLTKSGTGTLTLTGSGNFTNESIEVQAGGLTAQNGANISDGSLYIGFGTGTTGTATESGTGTNWSTSGALYVGYSGTGTLQITGDNAMTDSQGYIGENPGSQGTVTISGSGASWTSGSQLSIGENGNGALQVSGGGQLLTGFQSNIGDLAGSSGSVTISGSGSAWTTTNGSYIYVGTSGTGILLINNGATVTNGYSDIGYNQGSNGSVTVSGTGSAWNMTAGYLYVGELGTGVLSITNGGAVATVNAYLGDSAGSVGSATVSGSGTKWTNSGTMFVGHSGTGSLTVTGGTVSDVYAYVGDLAGSSGSATVSGSGATWTSTANLTVGNSGTGTPLITNGGAVSDLEGIVGVAGNGTATVTGTGSTWTNNTNGIYVGESGTGTLLITNGGTVSSAGGAYVDGAVTVNGSGSALTISGGGPLYLGESSTGTLAITSGGGVSGGYGYLGYEPFTDGVATVNGTGSTWANSFYLFVAEYGTGSLQVTGGGAVSDIEGFVGDGGGGMGTMAVSGSGSKWTNSSTAIIGTEGNGTLTISNGGAVSSGSSVLGYFAGATGMATVTGTGSTWTNSGDMYVGDTGSGTLLITSGGAVSAAATLVSGSGTLGLGENVTLSGSLNVSGGTVTLADGQVQTITLTSPVSIGAGSTFDFEVGNGSDRIALPALTMTGTGAINLYGLSGLVTAGTDVVIGAATVGNFSLGNVYNSGNFTYALLSTATSEDVVVTATSVLTTAYWKGGESNLWSLLAGGTATNWATNAAGTTDPHLTPSATTDVIFSATGEANENDTVLGTNMTVKSLTISDTNAVVIASSTGSPLLSRDTLTISGTSGSTGIIINSGAGEVTIGSNLFLSGSSQTITVNNAAGMVITGTVGGSIGLIKSGTGTLMLAGIGNFGSGTADAEFGTLDVESGATLSDGLGFVGNLAGSSGAVTVTGTGANWASSSFLEVGVSGTGALLISNGGVVSDADGVVGANAGSSGMVTVSATSTWTNGSELLVGESGAGTLLITSSGSVVSDGLSEVGVNAGSDGTVTVTGAGATLTSVGAVSVGASGTGMLLIAFGGQVNAPLTTVSSLGRLGFGFDSMLNGPLNLNGGTLALEGGEAQTVTLTTGTIAAGSTLDFQVGDGAGEILHTGALAVTGAATVNLYGLSGLVTAGTYPIVNAATSGHLTLGNVYNSGNFVYKLVSTATNEEVTVTATTALTTAYWKGGKSNVWSVLVGGTASNWVTTATGTVDPHLTPSATTNVIFSGTAPANTTDTVLGSSMIIASLTVNGTNAVSISGSESDPLLGTDMLNIAGTSGTTGITVSGSAGQVTIESNLTLSGNSQTIAVNNAAGLLISGSIGGTIGLVKSGTGVLTLTGNSTYSGATTVNSGTLLVTGSLTGVAVDTVASGASLEVDGKLNAISSVSVSGTLSGVGSVGAITINTGGMLAPGLTSAAGQALGFALKSEDLAIGGSGPDFPNNPVDLGGPLENDEAAGTGSDAAAEPDLSAEPAAGTLSANGNVTLSGTSTFSIRIGVNTASDNDQLSIIASRAVTLNDATLQLTLGSVLNNPANIGLTYVIINGGATDTGLNFSNTFAQGTSITTSGYTFDILYASNAAGTESGSDVVLKLESIPEPGSLSLMLGALAVFALMRRIRRYTRDV